MGCCAYVAVDARSVCVEANCGRFMDHLIMVLFLLLAMLVWVDGDHQGGLGKGCIVSIGVSKCWGNVLPVLRC